VRRDWDKARLLLSECWNAEADQPGASARRGRQARAGVQQGLAFSKGWRSTRSTAWSGAASSHRAQRPEGWPGHVADPAAPLPDGAAYCLAHKFSRDRLRQRDRL